MSDRGVCLSAVIGRLGPWAVGLNAPDEAQHPFSNAAILGAGCVDGRRGVDGEALRLLPLASSRRCRVVKGGWPVVGQGRGEVGWGHWGCRRGEGAQMMWLPE